MVNFRDLDAFKVCHELTLQSHRLAKPFREREPELASELWLAALIASSRIARGAGMQNRRMFIYCVDRSLAALSELGYHLSLARIMDLITEESYREIEGLRGRASFYAMKLLTSLIGELGSGSSASS